MLPTFLVIGAQKAATTSLWEYLRQHPAVFLPEMKEPAYLIDEGNWGKGQDWYESLFAPAGDAVHRGEASPGYTMFPFYRHAPERAATLMPEARLIYMIRHPVERMASAWLQGVGWGVEDKDLPEAALLQANYLLLSYYGLQLEQWLACFPAEQILVLRSEDLAAEPQHTLDRVLAHLGLEPGWCPPDLGTRHNPSEEQLVMPGKVRTVAGMLRRARLEKAAQRLGPRGPLKRLARPFDPAVHRIDPEVAAALESCFRADLAILRQHVGPDLDLWGLA